MKKAPGLWSGSCRSVGQFYQRFTIVIYNSRAVVTRTLSVKTWWGIITIWFTHLMVLTLDAFNSSHWLTVVVFFSLKFGNHLTFYSRLRRFRSKIFRWRRTVRPASTSRAGAGTCLAGTMSPTHRSWLESDNSGPQVHQSTQSISFSDAQFRWPPYCSDSSVLKEPFYLVFFYKNGPTPASFSFIFGLFQTNIITIFTTD